MQYLNNCPVGKGDMAMVHKCAIASRCLSASERSEGMCTKPPLDYKLRCSGQYIYVHCEYIIILIRLHIIVKLTVECW